jgi:hypothetical protein
MICPRCFQIFVGLVEGEHHLVANVSCSRVEDVEESPLMDTCGLKQARERRRGGVVGCPCRCLPLGEYLSQMGVTQSAVGSSSSAPRQGIANGRGADKRKEGRHTTQKQQLSVEAVTSRLEDSRRVVGAPVHLDVSPDRGAVLYGTNCNTLLLQKGKTCIIISCRSSYKSTLLVFSVTL